jgi:hypothetical protein
MQVGDGSTPSSRDDRSDRAAAAEGALSDAAQADLDASIAIMNAEQAVMTSRINALSAATTQAIRRLAAAGIDLAGAQQRDHPDAIAAARRQIENRRAELDRISLANTIEQTELIRAGLDNLIVAVNNKKAADAAHDANLGLVDGQGNSGARERNG